MLTFTKTRNEWDQLVYVAESPFGQFFIDGAGFGRMRWTVINPDGSVGHTDTKGEAVAWAEQWLAAQPAAEEVAPADLVVTVTASNGETYTTGDRAYVAGYRGPDVPVRILGRGDQPDTVRVKFSRHDHGRSIPRGSIEDVNLFIMLPAALVEAVA